MPEPGSGKTMESRHLAYADQGMTGSKLAGIIFAVAINVALLLALVFGLTHSKVVEVLERGWVIDNHAEETPAAITDTHPTPGWPCTTAPAGCAHKPGDMCNSSPTVTLTTDPT